MKCYLLTTSALLMQYLNAAAAHNINASMACGISVANVAHCASA